MNILRNMRHSMMRSVSKKNHAKRTSLCVIAMAIVACGLLIGCPEPASSGGGGTPNLAVTVPSTANVAQGRPATITVTVTNSGTAASQETMVTLHSSTSTTISATNATKIGDAVTIPSIPVNGNMSKTFTIPAETTMNAAVGDKLYYGACIVGSTPAKCSDAITLTVVAALPDLDVSGAKVTISGTTPYTMGNMVTLSVVVTNSGTKDSTDGSVVFYRQAGGSPAPATDTSIDTVTLSAITVGNTATATTSMFALNAAGTNVQYYAVVSGVTDETNADNNTSMPSDAITIAAAPAAALGVSGVKPTISTAASYTAGDMVTLSVVVANTGTAASTAGGTVSFYRAAGTEIDRTADGAAVATATIPVISHTGTTTATVTSGMFALGAAGTAQYYAVIAGVVKASMLSDAITIAALPAPDLTVATPTITPDTGPYTTDTTITLSVMVTNSGNAASAATGSMVTFHRVMGAMPVPIGDPTVGTPYMLMEIAAGGTATATTSFTPGVADVGTGVQYYATVTDANDSNPANNTSAASTGINIAGIPDLSITAFTISPNPVVRGNDATVTLTIENDGTVQSPMTTVRFELYNSSGIVLTTNNITATINVDPINAGEDTTISGTDGEITVPADVPHGVWNLRAIVGTVSGETNTGNNRRALAGEFTVNDVDLAINSVKTTISAGPYIAGTTATLSVVVSNEGNVPSPAGGEVIFFHLGGGGGADLKLGEYTLDTAIAAGATETATLDITLGDAATGVQYYAEIRGVPGETDTSTISSNISMLSDMITIVAPSDLEITQFLVTGGTTSVAAGGMFEVQVVVQNNAGVSPETTVSFNLLGGGAAPPLTGTITVPSGIRAGDSSNSLTGTLTVPVGTNPGTYRLRATVATVTGETDATNNSFFLGGTPSSTNFTITAIRTTEFNLASGCLVLIGDADNLNCGVARTTALATNEAIGTVVSSDATAFALANTISNPMFVIDSTSGEVTANRGVAIGTFSSPVTFDITVTGGAGAGAQRVRIVNDAATATNMDVTAQVGAAIATAATLFRPGESVGQPFACSDQGGGCITSLQTANRFIPNASGWYRRYNSGVTGEDALDVTGYSTVHIEYNLNTNTLSSPPPTEFTLRLGYTYFRLESSDGVVGDSTWQTFSMPLTRRPSSGIFVPRYVSNIGFVRQGNGVSLSVRAVYFR